MAIADAADAATGSEAKVLALVRLLRRAREPAIVFSEYRDTAVRLAACLVDAGHRVWLLHGGLTAMERERAIAAFTTGNSLLVATDAASEGLNLHHACRLVIHFELPWTPSRLEQRCGRVNRIGQSRRVHEIALVGRHTSEQLVLAPLLLRAARARGFARTSLMDRLTESRLAGYVLAGAPLDPSALDSPPVAAFQTSTLDLHDEACIEARRLELLRKLTVNGRRCLPRRSGAIVSITGPARAGPSTKSVAIVLDVQLYTTGGELVERLVAVGSFEIARASWPRQASRLRAQVERLLLVLKPQLDHLVAGAAEARLAAVAPLRNAARAALARRELETRHELRQTARQLVQAGLFDRRALSVPVYARAPDGHATQDDGSRRGAMPEHVLNAGDAHEAPIQWRYEIHAVRIGGMVM